MGGKTSTSTQQVSIPPSVLARYQSVNNQAQQTAATPFQTYSTNPNAFVAPINSTQQAGIDQTSAYANSAQPYFDAATGQLVSAQNSTTPYYGAATSALQGATGVGSALAGASLGSLYGANAAAAPLQSSAASNITGAQNTGTGLANASLGSLYGASAAANPIQYGALGQIQSSAAQAQPYNDAATSAYAGAYGAASPLNTAAGTGYTNALSSAQPYNGAATGAAVAGGQAVNANPLTADQINSYLSPYLQTVLGSTANVLNQQNQQQQAGQLGNAITSGAFGGDRAGIAAANLEEQQNLANANIYSGILNTGYNNALGVAQQQQGVNLGAAQANRAALQNESTQLQGIGQQDYTQQTGTAAAQQGLGAAEYGQLSTLGQNLQSVGQQGFNQGQTAATNAAGIGSTLFGQGATTAAQQAALGQQQYEQGLGAANAQQSLANQEFGQGATTSAQEAALGQQQFGQGVTASQQAATLGQDIYGTGAATSQGLANLGTGAQGAALSGAQAQLAAGTAAQQTQQAGLTALYNQFEQQQSYPFQVDQFLANIAEGTGALSGSTTTTTQPQSIFSDERLKDDIEPVGKTFDGQNIYKFRYKDGGPKQLGLMAQDVERSHPDAVGEQSGFKTVDYDKATAAAADKGAFYRGGLVPANDHYREARAWGGALNYGTYPAMPGVGPQDIAAMLSAQNEGYDPYGQGGLYGGSASAQPRGGTSYVPQANLPVGHLAVAGGLAPQQNSLHQAADDANQLSSLATKGQQGLGSLQKFFAQKPQPSTDVAGLPDPASLVEAADSADVIPFRRGGLARAKFDAGGATDPYAPGTGLNIPDDTPTASLPLPGAPPKPSGGGGLGDIAQAAETIAALIPKARGGVARANGGGVSGLGALAPFIPLLTGQPGGLAAQAGGIGLAGFANGGKTGDLADDNLQSVLSGLLKGSPDDVPTPEAPPGAPTTDGPPVQAAPTSGLGSASFATPTPPVQAQAAAPQSFSMPNYMSSMSGAEGTAKNPKSSAQGPYQIVNGTFKSLFRQMYPDRAAGMSDSDILALRQTPEGNQLSMQMGPFLTQQNIKVLQNNGVPITNPNVYLAHVLNPTVATNVLKADPTTPAAEVIPAADINANPFMRGKTAAQIAAWAASALQRGQRSQRATGGRLGYELGGQPDDPPLGNPDLSGVPATDPSAPDPAYAPPPPTPVGDVPPDQIMPHASIQHDPDAAPAPQKQSILDDLKKPEVFIPILTGLAAAASTPTVHPLMAIAEGLGAGAQAYQQQREYQNVTLPTVAQHQQEVNVLAQNQALEPSRIANATRSSQAALMGAQGNLANTMQSYFNSLYPPTGSVDTSGTQATNPDYGQPTYIDKVHGGIIKASQYALLQRANLAAQQSGFGANPTNSPMTAGLSNLNGGQNAGTGNGAGVQPPPNGGTSAGGAGTGAIGSGGAAAGPPIAPAGSGNVLGGGGGGGGVSQPAAPVAHGHIPPAVPGSLVAHGLATGAYKGQFQTPAPIQPGQFDQNNDPGQLRTQATALQAAGDTALANQKLQLAQDISDGKQPAYDVNHQPSYVFAQNSQINDQNATRRQAYTAQGTAMDNAATAFANSQQARTQILNGLATVYSNSNTNLSHAFADQIGTLASIPGVSDLIGPKLKEYQDAQNIGAKDAAMWGILQTLNTSIAAQAPASVLQHQDLTLPDPSKGAGARYELISQLAALNQQSGAVYNDWNKNKATIQDVPTWLADENGDRPITKYSDGIHDQLKPFPGMTQQEIAGYARKPANMAEVRALQGSGSVWSGRPFIFPKDSPYAGKIGYFQ